MHHFVTEYLFYLPRNLELGGLTTQSCDNLHAWRCLLSKYSGSKCISCVSDMWHNVSERTNIYLVHLCKFQRSLHTSQRGSSAKSSEIPVLSPPSSLYILSFSTSWAARLLFLSSQSYTEVFPSFKRPLCLSLITHPQDFLHVLVHHVGDANCWNDFEEVGGDAAIQARYTFVRYDVFELAHHGQLGFTLSNGWKKRKVKELKHIQHSLSSE